jgi:glutathione S-transferase
MSTPMLTLCGFPVSNYYNKVKLALLEKGIVFNEELVNLKSVTPEQLACSPLGKIPYLRTPQGPLCESQVIMEYIEAIAPTPALLPTDAYAAAKVRELCTFIDLHLELVARDLYGQAFFGGTMSDSSKERVRKLLGKNISAFMKLAKFSPMVAGGEQFTIADCAAWVSLPLVGMASKAVYGEDMLLAAGCDYKPYVKLINERPSAQKVTADRKSATASSTAAN